MEREDQNDSLPSINGWQSDTNLFEQVGKPAVSAKQKNPRFGSDKRRQDQGQGSQGFDQRFSRNVKTGGEKSERDPDDQADCRGQRTDPQTVLEASQIKRKGGDLPVTLKRKLASLRA